ncbi:MAG: BRO family protein [Thermodesulfobacteriota bacterium]
MPESAIVPYYFEGNKVRTLVDDQGELWFVAKDVCGILELVNSREALKGLDEDELMSEKLTSGGQLREMNLISESGLYTLIVRSNKPQAKPFRRWVTHDVLPAIRRTGSYSCAIGQDAGRDQAAKNILKACKIIESELRVCKKLGIDLATARHLAVASAFQATGIDYAPLLPARPSDQDLDSILSFVDESCVLGHGLTETSAMMFTAYQEWSMEAGSIQGVSQSKFNAVLGGIGGVVKNRMRVGGKRITVFQGIQLV